MTRKVLITGGSSGIGAAMVRKFASEGFETWYTYFGETNNSLTWESHQGLQAFPLDLSDYKSIQNLVSSLPSVPDVIVHNAGLGSATVKRMSALAHEQDEALIKVNAIGTLWLNELILPVMKERDSGTIIFISSVGGGITQVPGFRYSDGMSKAAIAFLGKILAADLAQSGINVFTICPGATDTPMFNASTLDDLSQAEKQHLIASLPKGRLIDPEEIAGLAHFLTTDLAKPLHGAVLDSSMGLGVNPGLLQK